MKKLIFLFLTVMLVCSLTLFACAEPEPEETPTPTTPEPTTPAPGEPKYGGTLRVSEPIFPGQPLGWPPDAAFAEPLFQQPCLEPLLQQDIDGTFHGRLATDWEVAEDGSSVTFTLRQGVKFHDGTDFNAEAVKFNFEAQMPTGKAGAANWESIEVLDEYTVRVNLKSWTNYTLSDFAYGGGYYIVSPTAYEKNGIEWMREHMVGTGPFKQVSIERDVQVIYEKFDDYWMEDKPYLDRIEYKCVADPMTQVAALRSQELDGMACGADKNLAELVEEGLVAVIGILGVAAYFPDSANPDSPLANQKVREALEYAIDKQGIADALSYGFWGPAYQYAPSSSSAYDPALPKREYNVDKAKQLLADAGYPDGFKMNFLVSGDEPGASIAASVQAFWLEIGVETEIELLESAKFEEYQRTGWSGLLYGSPTGPSNWIRTMQGPLGPDSIYYISVEKPDEYVELFNAASNSLLQDPVKDKAVVKSVYENAMCIPVWEVARAWVVQPYVKGGDFLKDASAFFWRAEEVWLDK